MSDGNRPFMLLVWSLLLTSLLSGCTSEDGATKKSSGSSEESPAAENKIDKDELHDPSAVSAAVLIQDYLKDQKAAEAQYKGKSVRVRGTIVGISRNGSSFELRGAEGARVVLGFSQDDSQPQLKYGQEILAEGQVRGWQPGVALFVMNPCKLIKSKTYARPSTPLDEFAEFTVESLLAKFGEGEEELQEALTISGSAQGAYQRVVFVTGTVTKIEPPPSEAIPTWSVYLEGPDGPEQVELAFTNEPNLKVGQKAQVAGVYYLGEKAHELTGPAKVYLSDCRIH